MSTSKQPGPGVEQAKDLVRINLNVTAATRKSWKEAALKADKTLGDLIIEAVTQYLHTQKSK